MDALRVAWGMPLVVYYDINDRTLTPKQHITRTLDEMIKIRRGTTTDNILLAEMGAQTFSASFGAENTPENMAAYLAASFSPQKQAAELADPRSVFLIAELDGEVVGYASLKEGAPRGDVPGLGERPIELARIYAIQAWIGKGVGAALMRACLQEAENRGCDAIWLGVWERNPRAISFYRKWGFVEVGRQVFQLGDDPQTDLVMLRAVREGSE